MRHRRIVCALILGFSQLAVSYHSGAQEPAFYWRTDLEQVLAESRTNPKLIWLQFTGSWCHFCRRMDAEVFPWAPVASLAKTRFQPVLIHSEHREESPSFVPELREKHVLHRSVYFLYSAR